MRKKKNFNGCAYKTNALQIQIPPYCVVPCSNSIVVTDERNCGRNRRRIVITSTK